MRNTGYALTELAHVADIEGEPTKSFLQERATSYGIPIIGGSISNKKEGKFYNNSLVFNRNGELVYQYDKIHLVPLLDEHLYLTGGQEMVRTFELENIKMGIIICYDLRFPELARHLAFKGAQVVKWPAVRKDHWQTLQIARAIENQFFVVSNNTVGNCNGTVYAGDSMIIDPCGTATGDPANKKPSGHNNGSHNRSKNQEGRSSIFKQSSRHV